MDSQQGIQRWLPSLNHTGTNSSTGQRSRIKSTRIKKGLEAQAPSP